ncbi:beta-1,4-N-acetylgalactosaminyltransferase bre-4 [Hydra vulgaris]|uniref:Beta-1,4-galactosyltransferase n=1 Tax=Hydra vulgaris TaxID=6087 RepID=A0ABM4C500_HYDVU
MFLSRLRYSLLFFGCVVIFFVVMHMFSKNYFKMLNSVNVPWQHASNRNIDDTNSNIDVENKISFRNHLDKSEVVNIKVEKEKETYTINESSSDIKLVSNQDNNVKKPNVELELKIENKISNTISNITNEQINSNQPCSLRGSRLVGALYVDQSVPSLKDLEKMYSVDFGGMIEKGGWWKPKQCLERVKVAIVIPFRNRNDQLLIFLRHMHPLLMRQELYYRIIVVEQLENDPFNRAGLFNVGYTEALKIADFNCFIFTDVDLLPEDDRNYYGCPTSPRHMSVAVDKFQYQLPYETIFGGVAAFTKEHFVSINGMSNLFWGWGGEDDDLYRRIVTMGYKLTRPSLLTGRYTMVKFNHFQSSQADPNRMNLLKNSDERMTVDGLNTLKYTLKEVDQQPLVTFVRITMSKSMYNM